MNNSCPNCGASNRTGARFCSICGGALNTAIQPAPPFPPPAPLPPNPLTPLPAPPPSSLRPGLFQRMPAVVGRITVVDAERQEKAPFDPARAMMLLAFLGVLAGLFVAFAAAGVALVVILAILGIGLGFLGCLAGLVFMPLRMILSPIIGAIRGDPTVSVLNFQVLDTATAAPIDVLLYRRPGGGNVRLGDVVQVHGSMRRNTNVVRAWSVQVVESGGNPTNYRIDALKPLPIWVGLLFVLLAVAAALWLTGVV